MTIAEVISIESAREDADSWNVIHFVKEGDFYRAHDWSAWLMAKFPFGEATEKNLKVVAKKMKDDYVDAFIGFPASSISKYIPNDGSVDFSVIDESQIDVRIELPADIGEVSFENLHKMKEEWKASLPLKNNRQKREDREMHDQAPRIIRFTDIISRIISLPIEDLTPREAYDILRDLRRQVSAMF